MKASAALTLVIGGSCVMGDRPSLIHPRQTDSRTSTINLATTRGKPEHVAASSIYGIPDNFPNQIPNHW